MPCDRIRRNITTACNLCRKKKQKCNGKPVCSRCQEKKIKCDYPKPKKRGPPKNIEYFRPKFTTNNLYNKNNKVETINLSNEVEVPNADPPPNQTLQPSLDNVTYNQPYFADAYQNNISNSYYSHYPVNTLDINPNVMITKETIEDQVNEFIYYYNNQPNNVQ
ncbi:hypothetical protein RhiirA4_416898 [Rhizophagus irregularis]|uniref:Zn(2)-C6 fungal-type domain-containing protein n=1 Tax=Rhizophagus irregularis TaxID=588596 RepID=A0A2I1G529_9GLOM|nr:hypothetical protein RhiirA4_416898 [Rhizophagus irregularis]